MRSKLLLILLMVLVFAGCESKKEVKFQGIVDDRDYVAEAMDSLAKADVHGAIKFFDLAIKQDPSNVENYLTLGQVYLRLNNPKRAVDTFSAATKIGPNNGDAFYMLAVSTGMQGGNLEIAVKSAQKSAEIFRALGEQEKFKQSLLLLQGLATQVKKVQAVKDAETIVQNSVSMSDVKMEGSKEVSTE